MWRAAEIQSTAHLEIKTISDQHERYIVGSMGIPFDKLVFPPDQCVIQQAARASRFRFFGQPFGQVRKLFTELSINDRPLLLRFLV